MYHEPKIKSFIKNNKTILLWSPGSCIEYSEFSGLNFVGYENLYKISNEFELEIYKNKKFDYFFIHGYELRTFDVNSLAYYNIKIKTFCIDLLGEGFDINFLLGDNENALSNKLDKFKTEVKILIPFDYYDTIEDLYPNYKFFKYKLGGPRIFCSRYNRQMIHGNYLKVNESVQFEEFYPRYKYGYNQIVYGLSWSDSPKDKLYMCLNGASRNHRIIMVRNLINTKLLDFGYVTFQSNQNVFNLPFKDTKSTITHSKIEIPQLLLDESKFEGKFGLHTVLASNSYIELVTESRYTNLPFKTEKCVKPFYNLQFPIILGHKGIIQDLRDMDFDMFDDIINHSYDTIATSLEDNIIRDDMILKCDLITTELIRLSQIDIHSIYLKNKERLLYNQENLYKKTILENNIFQELGQFIFGDDIEVHEYDFDKIEKLIITN